MLQIWKHPVLVGSMLLVGTLSATLRQTTAEELSPTEPTLPRIPWQTDYTVAMDQAVAANKRLVLFFSKSGVSPGRDAFLNTACQDEQVLLRQEQFVWAKIPRDQQITVEGQPIRLHDHAAFQYLYGRQGLAIVDLATADPNLYGRVVTVFPFTPGHFPTARTLVALLDLPEGTLTQRTLIFAVRIHPETPASATGQVSPVLLEEAESHSSHQANIHVQGHHNWESRFHRINGRLPEGMTSQEVVAESWPNQELVEAALDCVHSWRQSSGHWNAVRSFQSMFGYDIKLGGNGIWYATGLFAR